MPKLRVLIVDDAVVVRKILTDAVGSEADMEVHTAASGRIALMKLPQINPDAITLDMEMPELDGVQTVKEIRKTHPKTPIIMFSTLTVQGAEATLDALAAGANDYVTKPANVGSVAVAIARIKAELVPMIRALCGVSEVRPQEAAPLASKPMFRPKASSGPIEAVTIGISTGGPNALSQMLPHLPRNLPVPILIVQHMPPLFTKLLAARLAEQCPLDVKEGVAGMPVCPGHIIIAPGGKHMVVQRSGDGVVIATNMDPPLNSCRPAVDALFRSVATVYGARALALVLTGMGNDGMRGCEYIRDAGGQIVVQDEESSVVWGMPGSVARAGLAQKILALTQIAPEIVRRVNQNRRLEMCSASS
jgi:two-component system chemotaxis response regulator CheB